jgi:hypothetical protein
LLHHLTRRIQARDALEPRTGKPSCGLADFRLERAHGWLLPLLHCGASRDLEIQVLRDPGAVPAECIHVLADPLPRPHQVFVVEVDVEQIDVPRRLERSGDAGLDDLSRDGQCGVLRVVVDIPVACGCIVVVEANSAGLS